MFCSKCGKELQDDLKFCHYCGNPLNSNSAQTQPQVIIQQVQEKPKKKHHTCCIVLFLFIVGIFSFIKCQIDKVGGLSSPNTNNKTEQKQTKQFQKDKEAMEYYTPSKHGRSYLSFACLNNKTMVILQHEFPIFSDVATVEFHKNNEFSPSKHKLQKAEGSKSASLSDAIQIMKNIKNNNIKELTLWINQATYKNGDYIPEKKMINFDLSGFDIVYDDISKECKWK